MADTHTPGGDGRDDETPPNAISSSGGSQRDEDSSSQTDRDMASQVDATGPADSEAADVAESADRTRRPAR